MAYPAVSQRELRVALPALTPIGLSKRPLFETAQPTATGSDSRPDGSGSWAGTRPFKNLKSTYERVKRGCCRKGAFRKMVRHFRPQRRQI
jgi:hypothetical protein